MASRTTSRQGTVTVTVEEPLEKRPWPLPLRVPRWCAPFAVMVGVATVNRRMAASCVRARGERGSRPAVPGRPRVEAAPGCTTLERGPLAHVEEVDDLDRGTGHAEPGRVRFCCATPGR